MKIGDIVNYVPASGYNESIVLELDENMPDITMDLSVDNYTTQNDKNGVMWQVIGADEKNKKINLIASEPIKIKTEIPVELNLNGETMIWGKYGYNNGIELLNKLCSVFGHGKGAVEARSIIAEDINNVLKYDKTSYKKTENHLITVYKGENVNINVTANYRYGFTLTFYEERTEWQDNNLFLFNGEDTKSYLRHQHMFEQNFDNINDTYPTDENPITLTSDYYTYKRDDFNGKIDKQILDLIWGQENQFDYWVGTKFISLSYSGAGWGLYDVSQNSFNGTETFESVFEFTND